ncbi:kynureninase [Echinicola salinicaeni]|uniref:kynureninase n=1 Tax=Echinicola salinicaeni TaxID=2762757 RepID=UPI001646CC78|nr:kynureninase [Echinicola salinicaeni]
MISYEYSLDFAKKMDADDPLKDFRSQFLFPKIDGQAAIYFCGNSLGLQPKTVEAYLQRELHAWADKAVDGHFDGDQPWFSVHTRAKKTLAKIVGAQEEEVVVMNSLTSNLHALMVSFYRPEGKRFKILTEAGAFPSDMYMLESQVKFHGYSPEDAIIEIAPRTGEHTLRTEDILATISDHADELALVMMAGLQYYTGQVFDMKRITEAGHGVGALVGFDLAHAAGNYPLALHDWEVDFAAWCSYKYLNSGPGNVAGIYVHKKYANNNDLNRFAGWWGHDEKERFMMEKGFKPMYGADGWQTSNGNVLGMAAHQASLDVFEQAGIDRLRTKSLLLTGYLEYLIQRINGESGILEIITPQDPTARGSQLSLLIHKGGKAVFDEFYRNGIVGDWRNPNVIRLAPAPLYNSFEDVFRFAQILERSLAKFA